MTKTILIEEFHVSVCVQIGLPETMYVRARRTLDSRRFQIRLRKAVNGVFRRHSSLKLAKVATSV
ncbi:MAG: hypothetical protein HY289_05135 [Planctomycetes bacterium]|nr:hypothetical protein [Planctomycetota bacterium]